MIEEGVIPEICETGPALDRVLHSRVFLRAERSRRLLAYLVEAALAEPPRPVKEFTLACDVFGRGAAYDPAVDATVRVEAGRLRQRLREYYDDEGKDDSLRIEVPKGRYAVLFRAAPQREARAIAMEPVRVGEGRAVGYEPVRDAGVRPGKRGTTRDLWRWWIGAALAGGALLGGIFVWAHPGPARPPGSGEPRTVMILPVMNRTGDPAMDAVADGVTDDLIRQMSQIPALRVVGRSTAFRWRTRLEANQHLDPREAGRSLGVESVVSEDLRGDRGHLRLTAEMYSTADGTTGLDREYVADGDDLRSVQASLQHDLVEALHAERSARDPGGELASVRTNPEAYAAFLQGEAMAQKESPEALHLAIDRFQHAVTLDPKFDLAWSGMASAELYLGLYFEAPRDHMPRAREEAERALAINPRLGEAHGSLGLVDLVYGWNPAAAEAELASAGAQQAAISTLSCTAHLMERAGRPRTAESMLRRMLTYDPESASLIGEMGCVAYYRGDLAAALTHYQEALHADPRSPVPYWGVAKTLSGLGRYTEAVATIDAFRQTNGFEPPLLTAERGYALGAAGSTRLAQRMIAQLEQEGARTFVDPYLIATVYLAMGDRTRAFGELNRAVDARSPFLMSLLSEPKWEHVREDARFAEVVQRMAVAGPG